MIPIRDSAGILNPGPQKVGDTWLSFDSSVTRVVILTHKLELAWFFILLGRNLSTFQKPT